MFLYFIGATADMEDNVENPWMLRIKLVVKNESFWKWALDGAKRISVYWLSWGVGSASGFYTRDLLYVYFMYTHLHSVVVHETEPIQK